MKIVPKKLKIGDEIRVIAPSRSMKVLKEGTVNDGYVIEDDLGNQLLRIPSGYTTDGL